MNRAHQALPVLLLLAVSSCGFAAALLPWNVNAIDRAREGEVTHVVAPPAKPLDKEDPPDPIPPSPPHEEWCACTPDADPSEPRARWSYHCEADGSPSKTIPGPYSCCGYCHKVCGPTGLKKPPAPVPLPPDCPIEWHCGHKESCRIGGGSCCSACHHPCPVAASETE